MIKYKCASCGAKLETDDSLSGKQEACPSCQKVNPVPLSKHDLAEQQARQKENLRQEIEDEASAAEKAKQRYDNAKWLLQKQAEASAAEEESKRQRPEEATWTESILYVWGVMDLILALPVTVIIGAASENTIAALAAGSGMLVHAVLQFAASHALRYLRITASACEKQTEYLLRTAVAYQKTAVACEKEKES